MRRLALALTLGMAGAAQGGPLSDLVMAEGIFAQAPAGEMLRYRLDGKGAVPSGVLRLTVPGGAGGRHLLLEAEEGAARTEIARFPAGSANPLLLYFLEGVVREMAQATGGSPFYIRNRIRDALVTADASPGADGRITATLAPFAADPNRARLGTFGELRLHLRLDPARPGYLLSLKADTGTGPGAYSEEMVLIEGE